MSSLCDMENNKNAATATNTPPPGWNDPPPAINYHNSLNHNRHHLQRLRRPVDPSIHGNPRPNAYELSAPENSHFHQSKSFPQLHHYNLNGSIGSAMGMHPGSAFTPTSVLHPNVNQHAQQTQSHSQTSLLSTLNFTVANPAPIVTTNQHPNVLPAMAPSMPANLPSQLVLQSILPANSMSQNNGAVLSQLHYDKEGQQNIPEFNSIAGPQTNSNEQFVGISVQQQQQALQQGVDLNSNNNMMMSTIPSENQQNDSQNSIIFSPPNIVPLSMDQQCRPMTQPVPSGYRMPVKAAGDVSLNGLQLVAFLTKATLLLQQGPMREGIQLRINQFGDLVQTNQISEPCLKKLNFVVDAIDRHVYDEAWQFFEQMLMAYPNDCSYGGWAHGIRLLIQELRKGQIPSRAHSAGARHF